VTAVNNNVSVASDGASVALIQVDAHQLPFADEPQEAVVLSERIEDVPDPRSAMREIHRITRARACASAASCWRGHIYFLVAVRKVWGA
jgi:ubiquinone/menaquinone biosynthesis C-methylase UbiE